jgi:oligopeptide transport system substrate-binding protein
MEGMPPELKRRLTRAGFLKLGGAGLAGAAFLSTGCGVFSASQEGGQGGTGGGGSNSKTLNFNLEDSIADLDSSTSTDSVSSIILDNVNEGLFRLDDNLEPQPAQAQDVQMADDDVTYTFTLRDGINWSNGDPVTSQDFKYAWLRTIDPKTASQYAFIIADYIKGGTEFSSGEGSREDVAIETPDDKTLRVTLARPTPYFLSLTAFKQYLPLNQSFVEEQGDKYAQSAEALLYNGPYSLTRFSPNDGADLKKREDYWDAESVDIENVKGVIVKDVNTALNLYESGQLDRTGLSSELVDQFRDSEEFSTNTQFATFWLDFNQENETLANENIRRALQRGYDRKVLVDEILNDGSESAPGVVPYGMAGPGNENFRDFAGEVTPEFEPQEARRLWEQGVKELGGRAPTLNLLTYESTTGQDIVTFLQSQYKENLGANFEITTLPFDAKLDREKRGEFQVSFNGWIADYDDPSTFMDLYTTDNPFNKVGFSNERYDSLVNGARGNPNNRERMQAFREAEELLVNDTATVAPLFFEGNAVLTKPYLKNAVQRPFGSEFSFKSWKIERN